MSTYLSPAHAGSWTYLETGTVPDALAAARAAGCTTAGREYDPAPCAGPLVVAFLAPLRPCDVEAYVLAVCAAHMPGLEADSDRSYAEAWS